MVAEPQMLAHDRIHRRQADAAGREHHGLAGLVAVQLAGQAKRPGDAGESIAYVHAG